MSSLPTCWYCPECGWRAALPGHPPDLRAVPDCGGTMIEVPLIPPGTPPEQILNLVGEVRSGWVFRDAAVNRNASTVRVHDPRLAEYEVPAFVVIPRTEATDA